LAFRSLGLHPSLLRGIEDLGFDQPTPIQRAAIPPALAGKDLLACAMTGSGKTAAFLLPILHQLAGGSRGTTRALILTPTRELAAQIFEDVGDLAAHTAVKAAAIYGGVGMGPQEQALRRGVDVLIATPGRLLDHLRQPYANLRGVQHVVLDEADRMLDMGFLPDVRRILGHLPRKRQTLFFSATMPPPIAALAQEMLHDPVRIDLERRTAPATQITQAVYPVPQVLKSSLLVALLRQGEIDDALVFTRTKHRADRVARFLAREGIRASRIHGDRSQGQRTEALRGFKDGKYQVLVATDIAARGIDVEELGHVVNFDVPRAPEDYVHRVGRTGRAQASGFAFTFVSPEEEEELGKIERAVGKKLPRVTATGFDYHAVPKPATSGRHEPALQSGKPSGAKRAMPAGGRTESRATSRARSDHPTRPRARADRAPARPTRTDHAQPRHARTDHAPARHARTDHAPARHARTDHAPARHARTDHAPARPARTDHAPARHARTDHAPARHARTDHAPARHARTDHAAPRHARADHATPSRPRVEPTADRSAPSPHGRRRRTREALGRAWRLVTG